MSSVRSKPMTAEEFWRLPENGMRRALVRGEVVEEVAPGGLHGIAAWRLGSRLERWSAGGAGGAVGVESGFVLGHNPDVVRGPDVFYLKPDRVPDEGAPEAFWNAAPDLAVEVVSSSETAGDVREKVRDYLAAGTPLVWVVYPRTREVVVHTPDNLARTYGTGDVLEGFEVLPGFRYAVAELFG